MVSVKFRGAGDKKDNLFRSWVYGEVLFAPVVTPHCARHHATAVVEVRHQGRASREVGRVPISSFGQADMGNSAVQVGIGE